MSEAFPASFPHALTVEDLSSAVFAQFGSVIEIPRDKTIEHSGVTANQGSAVKYPKISPLAEAYGASTQRENAQATVSLFHCYPRTLSKLTDGADTVELDILERHPFTTQTFVPMGLDYSDKRTMFLVVVAPSCAHGPDIDHIRVFKANGLQGITYGIGTWHAPMIVVGDRAIPFVVTQFTNGIETDDCEEVHINRLNIKI